MARKEQILKMFPKELRAVLEQVSLDFEGLQELRLRAERPLFLLWRGEEYLVDGAGRVCGTKKLPSSGFKPLFVSGKELRDTVEFMGSFSLYAAEEELRRGFFTIQGGHRIGVAGRTVEEKGEVRLMKQISFLNVRVAHEMKGCADGIMGRICGENGEFLSTLIVSPPGRGKTTLLRDMVRQISDSGMNVGVVDERSELGACYQGIPQNDLGARTDVLDGCPKSRGMMMLVRSMSPSVIAVDELGGEEDVRAAEYVLNCGCGLAATVHGASPTQVRRRPDMEKLMKSGAFKRLILLDGRKTGQICGVFDEGGKPV